MLISLHLNIYFLKKVMKYDIKRKHVYEISTNNVMVKINQDHELYAHNF